MDYEMTPKQRRRKEAARKAWQTRKRRDKPSKVMLQWLTWLSKDNQYLVRDYISTIGTMFRFHGQERHPHFTRGTFFALLKRKWIEGRAWSKEREVGYHYQADGTTAIIYERDQHYVITDKGLKVLERNQPCS